ncbi:MAG: hypothetical protein HY284_02770 [Nitrospirae bacterium]|nr:hypothetical protein [Nitrospirota bacterium]
MPVFFIERGAIQGATVSLIGPLARHLKRSLRVHPGEHVWLAEAGGPRYEVRITTVDRDRLTGQVLSEIPPLLHIFRASRWGSRSLKATA